MATVNLFLNRLEVPAGTRQRVLEAIPVLGFVPGEAARAVPAGRSRLGPLVHASSKHRRRRASRPRAGERSAIASDA
ncbi:MAG: hypothetical protein M3Q27_11705 [Actinomycetota bacterium]|nr:hypothetical protein [Actinomycetota bacterium]